MVSATIGPLWFGGKLVSRFSKLPGADVFRGGGGGVVRGSLISGFGEGREPISLSGFLLKLNPTLAGIVTPETLEISIDVLCSGNIKRPMNGGKEKEDSVLAKDTGGTSGKRGPSDSGLDFLMIGERDDSRCINSECSKCMHSTTKFIP